MVSSVKAAAAGKVAAVKKEEVSPPKGDGQLSVMLAMGIAIIFITLRLADYLYEAPGVGETIFSSFIKTPLLGTGVNGDLFLVSFSYVPLMWLCIFLRNNGIGASVLKLKDVYNVVMTAFSLYCFLVMAAWRFRPEFEGEAHGKCETAISHSNAFGSFQLTAELFFWSKYVEWIDSVFLLYNNKPISVLHGFHHLGAPIAMGSMVAAKAEFVWIFVLWNSFIHTIMYFYFFATGIGIQWPRILRPYITSMQILQFCTGLPYLWVVYSQKISQDGGECATAGRSYSFLFQFVYVGIVLGLFLHFFIMSYVKPKKKSSKKTA